MAEQRNEVYKDKHWRGKNGVRAKVLKMDGGYCQRCLGKYRPVPGARPRLVKATMVHHHFPVKEYPQYRYSIWVDVDGKKVRNLWSLCNDCHEEIEGRKNGRYSYKKKKEDDFTNDERWD